MSLKILRATIIGTNATLESVEVAEVLGSSLGQIPQKQLEDYVILGESDEDGKLHPVNGVLPIAIEARRIKLKGIILPVENALEASIVNDLEIIGVTTVNEAIEYLTGRKEIKSLHTNTRELFSTALSDQLTEEVEVRGPGNILRALEIASAGGHNIVLVDAEETDKSTVKKLPVFLPQISLNESLDLTKIYSVSGRLKPTDTLLTDRPVRTIHHSLSQDTILGTTDSLEPGEVSLAHQGALFIDEISEYDNETLNKINTAYLQKKVTFALSPELIEIPSHFTILGSVTSCPCGNRSKPDRKCLCSEAEVQEHLDKIQRPLLSEVDIQIPCGRSEVVQVSLNEVRERIAGVRDIQRDRFSGNFLGLLNGKIPHENVKEFCKVGDIGRVFITKSLERKGLSPDSYVQVLKISRTIADLADSEEILVEHIAEALQFRCLY